MLKQSKDTNKLSQTKIKQSTRHFLSMVFTLRKDRRKSKEQPEIDKLSRSANEEDEHYLLEPQWIELGCEKESKRRGFSGAKG